MNSSFLCVLAGMVDVIFADVAQPDQTRIVALNAHNFLKNGGHFVISIKVQHFDCIQSCAHSICTIFILAVSFAGQLVLIGIHVTLTFFFQANCIDSTAAPEAVFAAEVKKMSSENMKPQEQLTLEPYERDHAVVVGIYRYTAPHGFSFLFVLLVLI